MTFFRRFILPVLLTVLALSGCGNAASGTLDALDGGLLIWHTWAPGAESEELNGLIDSFTRIHPNVTIVTEYVPRDELAERFLDQTRAGLGPDVLIGIEAPMIKRFVDEGALQPLQGYAPDTTTLLPEAVEALTLDSHLYGIPFSSYTNVLYYNREIVKREIPETVPDLLRAAQAGHRVGIPTDFYNAAWGIGSFGGNVFDENGNFALDQNAGFADWLTWLSTAQRDPNVILSNDIAQLRAEFEKGELAYFIGNSSELPELRAALGEEVVGVALLPPFGDEPAVPFLELEVIALSRSSARGDLAVEVAEFLVNSTQQRRLALSNLGRIPISTRTGRVALRVDRLASDLVQQREHGIIVPLQLFEIESQLLALGDAVYNQVLEGVLSPTDAVALLSAELEKVTP